MGAEEEKGLNLTVGTRRLAQVPRFRPQFLPSSQGRAWLTHQDKKGRFGTGLTRLVRFTGLKNHG